MIPGRTHISQVEGDLQVPPEDVREVGVHVQHLQQVVPQDLVKVAVGQRSHVRARLPRALVQAERLAKDIVLTCGYTVGEERCSPTCKFM